MIKANKLIPMLLALLLTLSAQATPSQVDSISRQLPTLKGTARQQAYAKLYTLVSNEFNAGRYYTALREAESIYREARSQDDDGAIATAYNLMSKIYLAMKDWQQAVGSSEKALAHLQKMKTQDELLICNTYEVYCKALTAAGRAEEMRSVTRQWLNVLNGQRDIYGQQGKVPVALKQRYLDCYLAMAAAEMTAGDYDLAEAYLKQAEQMADKTSVHQMADIAGLRQKYYHLRRNYQQALRYNTEYEQLSASQGDSLGIIRARERRVQMLMQLGRKAEAADLYAGLYALKDSLSSVTNRGQLNELNTLYNVSDKMAEAQRKMDLRKTIILWLVLVFSLVTIGGLIYFVRKQRRLVRSLTLANQQAVESVKMKESFIRQMSHEIRTPLNIINGFTQAITTPGLELSDEERADIGSRIADSANNITVILNNLLELSNIESVGEIERKDTVGCNNLAQMGLTDSLVVETEQVKLKFESSLDDAVTLHTDSTSATKIIAELLHNAQKFTTQGAITLSVRQSDDDAYIEFAVTDTGTGIPKKDRERVFEMFTKLDSFKEGVGAGLTMGRLLAQRLGGQLIIDPSYYKGCRFILSLPFD